MRRRALAEARYFAYALRALRRSAVGFALCWAVGTFIVHYFGAPVGGTSPVWDEAAYSLLNQYVSATSFPIVALNGAPAPLGATLTPQDIIQVMVPSGKLKEIPS